MDENLLTLGRRRRELLAEGISVTMYGGNCPVQIEGTLEGWGRFYFRARGCTWSVKIRVLDENGDPVVVEKSGTYGTGFDAGWMPLDEAIDRLIETVKDFREATKS